jgi:glutathione S-transferase
MQGAHPGARGVLMATLPDLELLMFMRSHYNEKARWALDWKGLPHRRRPLLPGPHARTIAKLTGQTMVPVLLVDGEPVAGSARILDALERLAPHPPLYPEDPAERARALEIQAYFDDEVGPSIRRAFFSLAIDEPAYLTAIFAGHRSAPVRTLYRAAFPLVKGKMRREMQIEEPHVSAAFEATRAGFDFVAKHVGPSGHLVGDRFSVADLTAAALLAPGVEVDHPDMKKPDPMPPAAERWLARWAEHPATAWVIETYRRQRPGRAPEA